jgi:hypothetical protein
MEEIKPGEQLDNQIRVGEFANSPDWKLVKRRLLERLIELDSLSIMYDGAKSKTIKSLGEKAFINGKVCKIIIDWISEVEADGQTLEANQIALKELKNDIIYRTE